MKTITNGCAVPDQFSAQINKCLPYRKIGERYRANNKVLADVRAVSKREATSFIGKNVLVRQPLPRS